MKTNLIKLIKYFGFKYYCPFCKWYFRKFLKAGYDAPVLTDKNVIGAGIREVMCPACRSDDRERLLYIFLLKKLNLSSWCNLSILHIAPENNIMNILKKKRINYITGDINEKLADNKIDIMEIKFSDNTFDYVICNHVLEHVYDDEKAMKEIFRVLKFTGTAILQVPIALNLTETEEGRDINDYNERFNRFGQTDHLRLYGKDYPSKLKNVGFVVEEFEPNDLLTEFIINKMKLNSNEKIYSLKKLKNK